MHDYILCYDIADPRRLGRVHRLLKKTALPVQYSVFLYTGTEARFEHCLNELAHLIDPRQDDVRAYPLPERGLRWAIGQRTLPEGIFWSSLPPEWNLAHPADFALKPA